MNVYILKVYRYSNLHREDSYIDLVYENEEDAWNRIEEKLISFIKAIVETGYKIREIKIENTTVTCSYEKFIDDMYGEITYEIHVRYVH